MDKAPSGPHPNPHSTKNGHIGDSPYIFPFNKNKLTSFILEELQMSFDVSLKQISDLNDEFATKFPFEYIPMYIYDSVLGDKKALLNMSRDSDDSTGKKADTSMKLIQETYTCVTEKFEARDIARLKE